MANIKPTYVDDDSGQLREQRTADSVLTPLKTQELTSSELETATIISGETVYDTDEDRGVFGPLKRYLVGIRDTGKKINTVADLEGDTPSWFETLFSATPKRDMLGYNSVGDGGGGQLYWDPDRDKQDHNAVTVFSPTHSASTWGDISDSNWYSADGTDTGTGCWVRNITARGLSSEDAGAVGDGGNDDTIAIQAMFDVLSTFNPFNRRVEFTSTKNYRITSTIGIENPNFTYVDATGARFRVDADVLAFDCNPNADPFYSTQSARTNFWWVGGQFVNTFGSRSNTGALLLNGFRNAGVEKVDFEGFQNAITFSGKDSIYFDKNRFFDNGRDIYNKAWSTIGGPLLVYMRSNHFSHGNSDQPVIEINESSPDLHIGDSSFNLGDDATLTAIHLKRQVQLYCTNISGTYTNGETLTGGTSGATMTVEQVVEYPDGSIRILGSNKSATDFTTDETVTGSSSGATSDTASTAGILDQNPNMVNISVEKNHWEAGIGANGAIGVHIEDKIGRGTPILGISIKNNALGLNGGGAIGVKLTRVRNIDFSANRFGQTSGSGRPIEFDSDCQEVVIDRSNFFSSGTINLNGMSRDEIDLSSFNKTIETETGLPGYGNTSVSNTGTDTIDMSTLGFVEAIAGLNPVGYQISLQIRDSASSSTDPCMVRIGHADFNNGTTLLRIGLEGITNDARRGSAGFVKADDNGDLYIEWAASGTDTMDIFGYVTQIIY